MFFYPQNVIHFMISSFPVQIITFFINHLQKFKTKVRWNYHPAGSIVLHLGRNVIVYFMIWIMWNECHSKTIMILLVLICEEFSLFWRVPSWVWTKDLCTWCSAAANCDSIIFQFLSYSVLIDSEFLDRWDIVSTAGKSLGVLYWTY